ncbi:MAG: peptidase S10 [Chloroflexi bacterium]|nr:peptidase S10 [Chloroflexota bacterium]MCC6894681.1 peptidase S10 [Anaerolineae bacterium]
MDTPSDDKKEAESKPAPIPYEIAPDVRKQQIKFGRRTLRYTTTAGRMALKNDKDEIEAQIYFTAYTLGHDEADRKRPLTFVFNGGPGSASVWLHLGALGPKRVKMQDEGWMPSPPYQLVDNEQTWLDETDLVFIDPVGTGYSRATKPELNKQYWNIQGDLKAVGEVIRLYLTRYNRWSSPLFLCGESYGTTRAAGLAGHLIEKGIAFNGIMLISTILNFQTADFDRGNDLPYALFLPTYAATAWYHKMLPPKLQQKPLRTVLGEVELWAESEYTVALMKGDRLSAAERQDVIEKLARYTGLSGTFIDNSNLRIHIMRFCKELLRGKKKTVGRLDSRFQGLDAQAVSEMPDFDPSFTAITPPYTAMMNDYARNELGFKTDVAYETLSFEVNAGWEWDRGKYADTSEALRSALAKNPYLKVLVAMGYYDLATPHFAAQYTLAHMDIDPSLRANIHTADYEAGHMLYLDVKSLEKLKADVQKFIKASL